MGVQLDIFGAEKNRRKGTKIAADNADQLNRNWQQQAYAFFITWIRQQPPKHKFMFEDVRQAAGKAGIPEPPSNRAWGAIAVKAARPEEKLIRHVGYGKTENIKAHRTPAAIWQKI